VPLVEVAQALLSPRAEPRLVRRPPPEAAAQPQQVEPQVASYLALPVCRGPISDARISAGEARVTLCARDRHTLLPRLFRTVEPT